jgi:transcriptional regulator with XRE-family HTH domain
MSQMDLALEAEVSTRHLSFVETGRSQPSRDLLLQLADSLDVPLRQQNDLPLAAGYAPAFRETPLDAAPMSAVRSAVEQLLASHEPFPALAVDRQWNIVSANRPALTVIADNVSPSLLQPPVNALRISLHPDGLAPRILNLQEWRDHLLHRIRRQIRLTRDGVLESLYTELKAYPHRALDGTKAESTPPDVFVPLRLGLPGGEMSFFSTVTAFGTPADVTVSELAVEAFFPANEATARALRGG